VQALQIKCNADERPLALYRLQTPYHELPKPDHVFDNPENQLDSGFASGIMRLALSRLQAVAQGTHRTRGGGEDRLHPSLSARPRAATTGFSCSSTAGSRATS
jgi:hypothetical protein